MKLRWPWTKRDPETDWLTRHMEEAVRTGRLTDDYEDPQLVVEIADEFMKHLDLGPGEVRTVMIEPEKLPVLIHVFRGFHTHRQLRRASKDLLIADGTDFERWAPFKRKILKWAPDYDLVQLQEEYDLARATVRSMVNWEQAQEHKDVSPNIQLWSAGDDLVIPQDVALDGIVRPVDDPFWDTWWPPNGWGWGCRSGVVPVREEAITNLPAIEPTEPMFANNVGKYGVKFPDEHPYSKSLRIRIGRWWRALKAR